MVLVVPDHCLQSDVIFVIEGTAVNGAYINDLKTNYIIPSLEYFSQGNIEEGSYVFEDSNTYYGIVVYQAADCLPHPSSDTVGPFTSASKLLGAIDKLELIGGKAESHANIAEGLATALQCFEELQQKREGAPPGTPVHRHCILVCHSPPYLLPVRETHAYVGKTAEQLAQILHEKNINLSIISPRKIPSLYKLFEKAGGDLNASQTKNYAKDPRHLVILKGFSLKERPVSPPAGGNVGPPTLPVTSLPSPLAADSPQQGAPAAPPGVGQSPVYRPPVSQDPSGYMGGMNQLQNPLPQGMGMVRSGAMMGAAGQLQGMPQMPTASGAPPGYHSGAMQGRQPPGRWPMAPPQPRPPYMQPGPSQPTPPQGSALIAQLTQPPSSMPSVASGTGAPQPQPTSMGQYPPQQGPQQTLGGPLSQQQPLKVPMMPGQGQPGNQQQGMQVPVPSGAQQPSQQAVAPSQAVQQPAQGQPQAGQAPGQQQGMMARERHTIWQGLLEWIEKPKNAAEQQKITKHVPCQVSANSKDGEPELKADNWPSKLIMQLMPKQLIGNIGGAYLKNSKSVLFHPQPCEALDSLTKVMSSGFAGCVHFTSIPNPAACDIKVLILLYTSEKRAYLGFIPNEQAQFVDRLRKVIQQQKSTQIMRQGGQPSGPAQPVAAGSPGQLTMPGNPAVQQPGPTSQPPPQQQPQQGIMMSTSNPLSMGGGQVVASQPGGPRIHMQGGLVQPAPQQSMQPRGGPLENQLQAERQHNLEKINQLKQTLEAAQQKEQQYMSQLERINHLKSTHLQDALHSMAQQQQRLGAAGVQPGPPQQQQPGQARMMRPVMANNPGLRHLLQQQPQYRQQLMGMGPRPPQMAPPPQQQQQQQGYDDVSNFDFM